MEVLFFYLNIYVGNFLPIAYGQGEKSWRIVSHQDDLSSGVSLHCKNSTRFWLHFEDLELIQLTDCH